MDESSSSNYAGRLQNNDVPPSYTAIYPTGSYSNVTIADTPGKPTSSEENPIERPAVDDGDDALLNQALEFTQHTPTHEVGHRALSQPVVIPQVGSGFGMPFARGYSETLNDKGISMNDFVEFIDNYNIVSGGSPPFQILDLAGTVVGMVPIHHAQLISAGIKAASGFSKAAVDMANKGRATKFVEKSNKDFFNPRGLKVEFATSEAVKAKLGMDPKAELVAAYEDSYGLSVHERRMASLEGLAAPVTFNVPAPSGPSNTLKRMAAAQQKRTLERQEKSALEDREKYAQKKEDAEKKISEKGRKVEKNIVKLEKERQTVIEKHEKELVKVQRDFAKESLDKPKEIGKIEKKRADETKKVDNDFQKELRKLDQERVKLDTEYEKEAMKETKDAKKDDKEVKASEKILWIFVEEL